MPTKSSMPMPIVDVYFIIHCGPDLTLRSARRTYRVLMAMWRDFGDWLDSHYPRRTRACVYAMLYASGPTHDRSLGDVTLLLSLLSCYMRDRAVDSPCADLKRFERSVLLDLAAMLARNVDTQTRAAARAERKAASSTSPQPAKV